MGHNNQPHTILDQYKADQRLEAHYEHLAQAASGELNDLLGDDEFDAWRDETRTSWQSMTWKQVYNLVEAKITEVLELRAYMQQREFENDHEPVAFLKMEDF